MMGWLRAIRPNRIGGQILLLVVFSVAVTQALNLAFLVMSDQSRREESQLRIGLGTFISGVRMIAASAPAEWPEIAQIVRNTTPGIDFTYTVNGPWPDEPEQSDVLEFIARDLGPGFEAHEDGPTDRSASDLGRLSVRLPDQTVVSARLALPNPPPRPPISAWSLFTFAVVFLPLVFLWAALTLSRQLRRFARAAEQFSFEAGQPMLPETGPEEIQQVARALNRMRVRIMGLMTDRTRMLSAIGHDLRTPITRLRLRAEFIEDAHTRQDILRDLDRMSRMVNSALSYIRDGLDRETAVAIDLPALVRTVSDNFTDMGEPVSYEGAEHLSIVARPDALVRAVENLIENALKYGTTAVVRTGRENDHEAFIEVEDDGAGIPEEKRGAMLEPFVRGDVARGQDGGFGLGLSITDTIARSHGGQLILTSGKLGGLLARLVLPASPEAAGQPPTERADLAPADA